MENFRSRLVRRPADPTMVHELLHKGQLQKAIRKARPLGVMLKQEEIDAAARAMFRNGRAGELLSCIESLPISLPYDVPTLLRRAFEVGDYHAFLKQAHRLRVKAGFEREIDEAIRMIQQKMPGEAAAWRRKFCDQ